MVFGTRPNKHNNTLNYVTAQKTASTRHARGTLFSKALAPWNGIKREYMDNFATQYGYDFNNLDADAICGWYEYPVSVLTPEGNSIFQSKEEFLTSVEKLLIMYRSFNFSRASVLKESISLGKYGLNQNDVMWRLIDNTGETIIDFEITYIFKKKEERIVLCGVVSHNEFFEWKKKLETKNG